MHKYEVVSTYTDRDGNTVLPGSVVEVDDVYGARLLSARVVRALDLPGAEVRTSKRKTAVKKDVDDTQEG